MRVLITRPEREATALAAALIERGHQAVIAPLFQLQPLGPPADFAQNLAASQAVLLTSANGARALAEASEQRGKPVFAVGDTTASTAEGLGFTSVASAAGDSAALADLVRRQLDPAKGPLLHVSGVDVAGELGDALAGFELRRYALYQAREAASLPEPARAALAARALDVATFFSPRAASLFARLANEAGVAASCREVDAIAISAAAGLPLQALPWRSVRIAAKPSRQAVLDEIDRLAEAGVQGHQDMSDTPSPSPAAPPAPPVVVRRGPGVIGTFFVALIASSIVLAAAVATLPHWPPEVREMWRGAPPPRPEIAKPDAQASEAERARQAADRARLLAEAEARARTLAEEAARRHAQEAQKQAPTAPAPNPSSSAAIDELKRDLNAKLEDLDKRVRAAATTAAQADRPAASDPTIAELRAKIEALEAKPAGNPETDKEVAALKGEVAGLRAALNETNQRSLGGEQKAVAAARASAVIGIAARLSAALETGLAFSGDLALLQPFAKDDPKLAEIAGKLQPFAGSGVVTRVGLVNDFPGVAKAALADDLADDSFWQRVLGKVKAIVSLRRVGADVEGDSVEAKLARAEAALDAGDVAKAVDIIKSLPAKSSRATAKWLAAAEAHLAAQRAIDQLAAHAVTLLGSARP